MAKKKITIENLAEMVQEGFRGTAKKEDMNFRFNQADKRFDKIEERLKRIEGFILAGHERRIEDLEIRVQELRDALAIK